MKEHSSACGALKSSGEAAALMLGTAVDEVAPGMVGSTGTGTCIGAGHAGPGGGSPSSGFSSLH